MRLVLAFITALPAVAIQESIRITLERTACFGTCPVYSVAIHEDGRVVYEGRQYVRESGTHTWRIDATAVRALAAEIDKAGFFEMKNEYTAPITDQPTTYTTVTIGSRTKRIKDYYGAPTALKEIEARIDTVAGTQPHVRGDMEDALARGDAARVRALLAGGADPRARDDKGVTLVMQAAMSGDPDTVRAVLAAGGDPTARDAAGRNAADRVRDMMARDPGNAKLAAILRLLTDE
jgi:hypothetical protein